MATGARSNETSNAAEPLRIVQVAFNTADLAGSLRFYREVFGFENAGGNALWGEIMRIQGLQADARSLIWWMTGGEEFQQIELFHHTKPAQRPLPADWRPNDLGWTRIGFTVRDLEEVTAALARWHVSHTPVDRTLDGLPRVIFRDPFVGVIVEAVADASKRVPCLLYAASSVANIDDARHLYEHVIDVEIEPLDDYRAPGDETLWDLSGARRDGFLARFGNVHLEVVCYREPLGRTLSRGIADQGIMNVAFGSRTIEPARNLVERMRAAGHESTLIFETPTTFGTYVHDPGCEFEIVAIPKESDSYVGFAASSPFLGELGDAV